MAHLDSNGRPRELFVVRRERGGPWEWSRDMREQEGWDEHARFMDALADSGIVVLGGPLEGDREALHIMAASSADEIDELLAEDPWTPNGMLCTKSIERWTILLDGRN
jgi:uncharacterized protein YciI